MNRWVNWNTKIICAHAAGSFAEVKGQFVVEKAAEESVCFIFGEG